MLSTDQTKKENKPALPLLQFLQKRRSDFSVVGIHLLLAFVITWPLLLNFGSAIVVGIPDSGQHFWDFWWAKTALLERHANPFYTDMLFYPYHGPTNPLPLYVHSLFLPISFVSGILAPLLGNALTYNLLFIFDFVVTGWATYALARYFTGSFAAALAASIFYNFSTYHQRSLNIGQIEVFWQELIPLALLFLHKALVLSETDQPVSRKRLWLYPALTVLCLWLQFLISPYYFLQLGLYAVFLYLILAFQIWRRRSQEGFKAGLRFWQLTGRIVIIGLAAIALCSPLLFAIVFTSNNPDIHYVDTIGATVEDSVPPLAWLIPGRDPNGGWRGYFLGTVPVILGVFGLVVALWKKATPEKLTGRRWIWWWAGVMVVMLLLSMGPYLRLAEGEDQQQAIQNGINLPFYQWFTKLPFLNISRSPVRFMALATLGLSLIAGWGLAGILGWLQLIQFRKPALKKVVKAGSGGLVALLLALYIAQVSNLPLPMDDLYYPAYFNEIKKDPNKQYGLLELPINTFYVMDSRRMYFQTIHQHPISSGYISRPVRQFYDDYEPVGYFFGQNSAPPEGIFPDNPDVPLKVLQMYDKLYQMPYVVHYKDDYTRKTVVNFPKVEKFLQTVLGSSARVFDDGRTTFYRVPPLPANAAPAILVNTAGGFGVEKLADGTPYRWTTKQLKVQVLATVETEVQLDFVAWSLRPQNSLTVQLEGQPSLTLNLGQSPTSQTIRLKVKPGRNELVFNSVLPGATAQELNLPYQETRKLAFALGKVQLSFPQAN